MQAIRDKKAGMLQDGSGRESNSIPSRILGRESPGKGAVRPARGTEQSHFERRILQQFFRHGGRVLALHVHAMVVLDEEHGLPGSRAAESREQVSSKGVERLDRWRLR